MVAIYILNRFSHNFCGAYKKSSESEEWRKKNESASTKSAVSVSSKLVIFNCAKRVNHLKMELVFNLKLKYYFTLVAIKP